MLSFSYLSLSVLSALLSLLSLLPVVSLLGDSRVSSSLLEIYLDSGCVRCSTKPQSRCTQSPAKKLTPFPNSKEKKKREPLSAI
ncbi:hypothetical protein BDZ91DRAFT_244493 [Kalaharituber pfeilii]|nr:hypothetical protein BDZ91DRAFT_244493 [Kalaharituber pfeilii]